MTKALVFVCFMFAPSFASAQFAGSFYVLGPYATEDRVILNQDTLQSGASFYVLLGSATKMYAGEFFGDGAGIYNISTAAMAGLFDSTNTWTAQQFFNNLIAVSSDIQVTGDLVITGTVDGVDISVFRSDVATSTGSLQTQINVNNVDIANLKTSTASLDARATVLETFKSTHSAEASAHHAKTTNAAEITSGLLPNARLDSSSVTLQANVFNVAGRLTKLDGAGDLILPTTVQVPIGNFDEVIVSSISGQSVVNFTAEGLKWPDGTIQVSSPTAVADNLGDHTATQDLNLNNYDITNVSDLTASATVQAVVGNFNDVIVTSVSGNSLVYFNADGLHWPDGTVQVSSPTLGADNLGDHTATQDLNLNNYDITGVDDITTEDLYVSSIHATSPLFIDATTTSISGIIEVSTHGIKWPDGTVQVSSPTPGAADNLGNHTATQDLNMANYDISSVGDLTASATVQSTVGNFDEVITATITSKSLLYINATTMTVSGIVEVSAQGIKWADGTVQVSSPTPGAADNLGNHEATQVLNMSDYNITNVGRLVVLSSGTRSALRISSVDDPDTGIYFPEPNRIELVTRGVASMSLVPGLNVGITWQSVTAAGDSNWKSVAMSDDGKYQTAIDYTAKRIKVSSDYGVSWAAKGPGPLNWISVGISSSGQYQSAGIFNGYIYRSSNFGQSWSQTSSSGIIRDIDISWSGQYQIAANQNGYIYVSSDSGVSWAQEDSIRGWYGVAVSSSGEYQSAVDSGTGYIYISSDFGQTWTPKESQRTWYRIRMSANGQYQTAGAGNEQIYTSDDYGDSWTARGPVKIWTGLAVSNDGQNQTITATGDYIYTSSNYGVTWFQRESGTKAWSQVAMSGDGVYQLASHSDGYLLKSLGGLGGVGIGTTIPQSELTVAGNVDVHNTVSIGTTIRNTSLTVLGDADFNGDMRLGSAGTPSTTLDVDGEVNMSGIAGDGIGKVVCIKSDGNLGTCSNQPDSGGVCTCN